MAELRITRKNGDVHIVLFDAADAALVSRYSWRAAPGRNTIYAQTSIGLRPKRTTLSMHRLLCPEWPEIDHKNGNGLDNRRENLRDARGYNHVNTAKGPRGASVYKGVTWSPERGKWRATISVRTNNGIKNIGLGRFADEIEAAKAYDRAALDIFGVFAHTNGLAE